MLLSLFENSNVADCYVDLGTANTLVAVRGKGLVVNEPSVIAYNEIQSGRARKVVAVGLEAQQKASLTPGNIISTRPLKESVIADYDITETMLRYFLSRPGVRSAFLKPRVITSIPWGLTNVEQEAIRKAVRAAGAREVFLVDEPMVAAIGADLPVKAPQGSMVIDIGGGATEVAVVALADIVCCEAIRVGGNRMDENIIEFMRRKKNIIINDAIAENLKVTIGTALPKIDVSSCQVQGRDTSSGLTRTVTVTSEEIGEAIRDSVEQIIEAVRATLEETPPELLSDLIESGLVLTGGGALVKNLAKKMEQEIRLPIRIAADPLTVIARGGEKLLADRELLEKIKLDI
ncbi:MAG: rod shape-determining protein [Pseudobdellovibrionaceae bacterium]